ncbi:MAG: hypothetical protein IKV41_00910 [Oscillospiraceae bacterium]|nr:hypothetical protein [Oscillospiraceae bacterium]
MNFIRCGIQEPIQINNIFLSAMNENKQSEREKVMDSWIRKKFTHSSPENTKCPGRVSRRCVNNQIYRYQCQYASDTSGFGFSKDSVEEDIELDCTVVVFKQLEDNPNEYRYWKFKWDKTDGDLHAVSNTTILQCFKNWDQQTRAVFTADNKTKYGTVFTADNKKENGAVTIK